MIVIKLKDGFAMRKRTCRQVVDELRQMEMIPCKTNAEYMKRVAIRFKNYYGKELNCSNESEFINQLIEYNELEEVRNNGI